MISLLQLNDRKRSWEFYFEKPQGRKTNCDLFAPKCEFPTISIFILHTDYKSLRLSPCPPYVKVKNLIDSIILWTTELKNI